ncbi:HAD family acid phosphatase [Mycoplasma phocoeninasale]|uniref:HAD family acid phosphatase n=1 Tax=Mycoplasma phocoeninasale TaxID=2726117 RepID=UPI0019689C47|nr:hypothetical protein [Mycoplasma phocoeninasale]
MIKWKFLLGALAPLAALPVVVASCTNKSSKDTGSTKEESIADIKKKLEDNIEKLSEQQKIELINALDVTKTLNTDQKAELIEKLNKGAGAVSSIVWYMNSAESRIAQIQAYRLATIAFDNLKKRAETDKMDYAALKQADGKVSNPADRKFVPVVFMDIDETVFINEYTQAWTITDNNGQFSETKKDSIDAIGNRKPIPGAIEFIKHVFEAGGIVMFNSGIRQLRPSIDGIKKNLIAAGLDAKYVHDWMFWTSGVNPLKADGTYQKAPWKEAIRDSAEAEGRDFWRATTKNQRMNAVSDNEAGWDFSQSQEGSGKAVKTRVIMRIGDDFNDFYDDAYKSERSTTKSKEFSKMEKVEKLFKDENGSKGIKVVKDKVTKKVTITDLDWYQFNVQVPGNSIYGGWNHGYGFGSYKKLWDALKEIKQNSQDQKQPQSTN